MKPYFLILAAAAPLFLLAGNAVFNPGFELGTDGYALNWILDPVRNPELQFHALRLDRNNPAAGRQSLKIENPNGEFFELHGREFPLEAGKNHTASVMARSDVDGSPLRVIVYTVTPDDRWMVHSKEFRLSTRWEKYSFSFTTAKSAGFYHFQLCPGEHHNPDVPKNNIWLDEFELETSGTADPVEAAVVASRELYERGVDSVAKLELRLHNPGNIPVKRSFKLRGVDAYFGTLRFERIFEAELAPGELKILPFEQPLERFGGIRVEIDGLPRSMPGYYAVIGHYEASPIDVRRDFCVGINGVANFSETRTAYPGFYARGKSVEEQFRLLGQMGCRLVRERDGGLGLAQWHVIEPEEGRFDFRLTDLLLAFYRRHHLTPMPILGDSDFIENFRPWEPKHLPDWLKRKSVRVKDDPPNVMKQARGHVLLPPPELWRHYVRTFAMHYRGMLQVCEIMNEPNLFLAPEVYMEYLRIASEELRAADPDVTILGLCPSSDHGGEITNWLGYCLKAKALDLIDGISFHPYSGRELGSVNPADSAIAKIREQAAPYRKLPLWNTELFYCFDTDSTNSANQSDCNADQASRRFLTDLGEGLGQSVSLHFLARGLWMPLLTPNLPNKDALLGLLPSPVFVAYNALARHFEGAKPTGKWRYPRQVICYGYRNRKKQPLAAIWNYGKNSGIAADLSEFEVLDLFGNPVKAGVLPVTKAPYFLFPGKLTGEEFFERLEHLKMMVSRPVAVNGLVRQAGTALFAGLHNDGEKPLRVIAGFRGGGLVAVRPVQVELAPGETATVEFEVRGSTGNGGSPEVILAVDGCLYRDTVEICRNPTADGGGEIRLESPDGKLRASATLSQEGGKLVISIRVEDGTDAGPLGGRSFWESDSVELFLDREPEQLSGEHPGCYRPATFRLFLLPRDQAERRLQIWGNAIDPQEVKVACSPQSTGYAIRLELPAERVLSPGGRLGFDIKINDSEAPGKKAVRSANWSKSPDSHKNRCVFGIIRFEQTR